ncbi:hypothetical protein E1218_21030 [Kribbella turkmenica]|uniref:Uncharacterized protein n=1 Tax=Kribbella turkmenica TaxID=2530375 RepID=A0A4V2YF12_9ACTN|nr:hypothetical protein [Kribbella turkmenica]TDD21387.1 hypothetical protein E1218_21030 [Kribbella turkmenica]
MSSIVPGPQKKLEEEISAARSGGKPLSAGDLNPSAPRKEQLAGLDDWPPSLRAAVEADYDRVTALATNRRRTADRALPEVVRALDTLLDQLAEQLRSGRPRLLRKSSSPSPEVPPADLAELLGIPAGDLATPARAEHRAALRTIRQLRGQLNDLETTPDHSRLTRLSTFVIRLAVVLDAVPDAAAPLASPALSRFADAEPDYQWDWPFHQKLTFWQETRHTLTDRRT